MITPGASPMYPSFMPDLVGIDIVPDQAVSMAAEHGFVGIDLRLTHRLGWLEQYGPSRFADLMAMKGVRPGYASMLTRTLSAPADEWGHMLEQLPRIAALAQALGFTRAGVVVLPFDDRLDFPANRKQHLARLGQVAPVLADHGIRIGLEYVSPKTRRADAAFPFVHGIDTMLDLIGDSKQSNVGFMLDSFHWHCAGETVSDLTELEGDDVVVVHINDAPHHIPTDQLDIRNRELPGDTAVIDLTGFLGALQQIGYSGPVTAEPTNARWSKMEPGAAANLTSRAVLETLGAIRCGCDGGMSS